MEKQRFDQIVRGLVVLLPPLLLFGPAVSDGAVMLIAGLFLLRSARLSDWGWMRADWVKIGVALWLYICARDYFTHDLGPWQRSLGWVRFLLFAAALQWWLLPDAATRKRLLTSMAVTVGFLVLDTLLQYWRGTDLFGRPAVDFEGAALPRLTGPFSNPRVGVTMLWLMFPALLAGMLHERPHVRLLGFAGAALAALAIYVSGERMANLLMLTGFGVSFLLIARLRKPLLLSALLAALAGAWLGMNDPLLVKRQIELTRNEIAGFWQSPYGQTWVSAWKIGKEHPLAGVGAKQFRAECRKPEYGATDKEALIYRCPMHTHNIYLERLVEHGAIGLALFVMLLAALFWPVLKNWRQWYADPVAVGLVLTLALRLWPINAQTSQYPAYSAVPFWLFVGWMLVAAARDAKR